MSLLHHAVQREPLAELSRFRGEFCSCLSKRADGLFELADAVPCADGPVRSLVELSLVGEHRRRHGGLYDALAAGQVEVARLRRALAAVPLPRAADGRLVLAADITCWLRPDGHTSPRRILCHTYGRGKDQHIPVPGWPYSVICALESGRSSWTAPLDALRLEPGDDAATVTARQMRELVPPPASAATSGTSAHRPPVPPRHRNPPAPAPDDHRAARTPGPPHATTCTQSAKQTPRNDQRRSQLLRSCVRTASSCSAA